MITLAPSAGGGSAYQRDGGEPGAIGCRPAVKISSSYPGEIHSARLRKRGSLTRGWSRTGNCIVIPIGCASWPRSASCVFTTSMTQYCHSVESPQTGGSFIPKIDPNSFVTDPAPGDSFPTPQSTL